MKPSQVILITGASRGIGAALAVRLAAPGRMIAINFRSRRDAAEKVAREVEARGAQALLLPADVTSPESVDGLFSALSQRAGRLDVLISNAGVPFRYARAAEIAPGDFEAQWRSQAGAAHLCCRRAIPLMLRNGGGRIVFVVSSVAQGAPPAFMPHYVSAKYALWGFAQALSGELSGKGIRVDCVFPPMTDTEFIKDFPRPIVAAAREGTPAGRLSSPAEVAEQVAQLLADRTPEAA
ncbi:MAG: SDR family NAD(P)-dependent oxidoreductase [Elusimicrobia bacterium]|nr:SDR family NAD(P)-dependent oxidoreductase [Elusimicrobiota bacterium]